MHYRVTHKITAGQITSNHFAAGRNTVCTAFAADLRILESFWVWVYSWYNSILWDLFASSKSDELSCARMRKKTIARLLKKSRQEVLGASLVAMESTKKRFISNWELRMTQWEVRRRLSMVFVIPAFSVAATRTLPNGTWSKTLLFSLWSGLKERKQFFPIADDCI